MFRIYHSNQIENHKDLLVKILQQDPNPDPFAQETVLVQSLGMAQWLQMQLAQALGVAGNVQFPYPTRFLWQQYRALFPELPKENIFDRNAMLWRLMRLIPTQLDQPAFSPLAHYLAEPDQLKLYQLASKIADLFDQYLVYRPHWLIAWEKGNANAVLDEIKRSISFKNKDIDDILATMQWQQILWNQLVDDIRQDHDELTFNTSHRAYLQQRYFDKLDHLTPAEQAKLPPRIFVFGISSLPQTQLQVLQKLSQYINVHLFFTNPSKEAWGDDQEQKVLEKLALKQRLSGDEIDALRTSQGNPLLSTWGKQGKEFLNLLMELEQQPIELYDERLEQHNLLTQLQRRILNADADFDADFEFSAQDRSVQLHSCHSKMREVEVLHNQLLALFEQDPQLSPKDIIVMSPDIDSYAPYINAVFGVHDRHDRRFIPFTLSDQKISHIDPIIASFLTLLSLKERQFTVDDIFDLFDVQAIREHYQFSEAQLAQLKQWIVDAGIRAGLAKDHPEWQNYNSWENGINRLLLGMSLKAENQGWQGILAFDQSYGLNAELAGHLAKFIEHLTAWVNFIQQPQPLAAWQTQLSQLLTDFYQDNEQSLDALLQLQHAIDSLCEQINQSRFNQPLDIQVIAQLFQQVFSEQRSNLNFLVGKVNFCTLLPMRAIPFKVVCLLGMNEGEFPRQPNVNSFDLMQFAPQKGDRAKRDDDRYLFLEALLAAQNVLYISYIGQSLRESGEKYPSILVSQLIDYIQQNLPESNDFAIIKHPMTVFSPKNVADNRIAYNKEWLAARSTQATVEPFLNGTPAVAELPDEIAVQDLIAYVQSPVAFYFARHLGVVLQEKLDPLPTAEPFVLSGLEKFNLLDELLNVDLNQTAPFFNLAKLSGFLPPCNFGKLAEQELTAHIQALQAVLSPYLQQERDVVEIDYTLSLADRNVRIVGNLPNRFGDEMVQWRVGRLREKDIIQCWIYYLLLHASQQPLDFRFYYREGTAAKPLRFALISAEQAAALLHRYVQDYLASFSQLRWAITEQIADYLSDDSQTSPEMRCQTAVQQSEDRYIQRLLSQSPQLDYAEIHQRTLDWFGLMIHKKC